MNILNDNVDTLHNLDDLKGKTIVDVVNNAYGEYPEFLIVTDDNCILHMDMLENYGDKDFGNIYYEHAYQNAYKYDDREDFLNVLERYNLINLETKNRILQEKQRKLYEACKEKEQQEYELYQKLKLKFEGE